MIELAWGIYALLESAMSTKKEHVLLLHGYTGHGVTMKFIENYFKENSDYIVHTVSYLSVFRSPDEILKSLSNHLNKKFKKDDVVNIVGHSLGGILARCLACGDYVKFKIKRVVTIGSPHRGTSLATNLLEIGMIRNLVPMATALAEGSSFIKSLPKITVEMGSIAGKKKSDFPNGLTLLTSMIIGDRTIHDGLVDLNSTYVPGLKDYAVFDVDHISMLVSSDVLRASLSFVKTGSFK